MGVSTTHPVSIEDLVVSPDSADIVERFQRYGVVIVRAGAPVRQSARLTNDLKTLALARLRSIGDQPDPNGSLDDLYDRLCARDRVHGSELYDIGRHIGSFYDLIRCDEFQNMARRLMPPEALPSMPFSLAVLYQMRPDEDERLFDWHQDYTYNVMGHSAISVWMTLTSVDAESGALVVAPGSHRSGAHPVAAFADDWVQGSGGGGRIFRYRDLDIEALEKTAIALPLEPGDVLYFHALLFHRSGPNRSRRTRWTVSTRFGDLLDPELVARGWIMGPKSGGGIRFAFRDVHPELSE